MPRNLYADLNMFANRMLDGATLVAADATEIEKILESQSRSLDEMLYRTLFAQTDTRVFDGNGCSALKIPDLLSATTVKLDEDGDRTFEVTLAAATDYYLLRHGYEDEDALPATMIRLDGINGVRSAFLSRPRLLQIVGSWGFTATVEREAPTATVADATTTVMTTTAAGSLCIGQTLLLGTEQVYISGGTASPWTIARGVNGTTAAAHAALTAIDRYVYVADIREATMILAVRVWKRRETGFSNVFANPVVGSFETYKLHDPDVTRLIAPYIRGDRLV